MVVIISFLYTKFCIFNFKIHKSIINVNFSRSQESLVAILNPTHQKTRLKYVYYISGDVSITRAPRLGRKWMCITAAARPPSTVLLPLPRLPLLAPLRLSLQRPDGRPMMMATTALSRRAVLVPLELCHRLPANNKQRRRPGAAARAPPLPVCCCLRPVQARAGRVLRPVEPYDDPYDFGDDEDEEGEDEGEGEDVGSGSSSSSGHNNGWPEGEDDSRPSPPPPRTRAEARTAEAAARAAKYGPAHNDADVKLYLRRRAANEASARGAKRGGLPLNDSLPREATFAKLAPAFQRQIR
jgi:hypothetical protein